MSLTIAVVSLVYLSGPFKFVQGKRPVVHERLNHSTLSVFSFPAAFKDIRSNASLELASLGFSDTTTSSGKTRGTFMKNDRNSLTQITILNRKFSDKSTDRHFVYEPVPGWVSVEIRKFSETKFQKLLNRLFPRKPLPPDPFIQQTIHY